MSPSSECSTWPTTRACSGHENVLEAEGWELDGNVFTKGADRMLPLYEAKMIHHFDHRSAPTRARPRPKPTWAPCPGRPSTQKADPTTLVLPRYWVGETEVNDKLKDRWDKGWLLGWRDITELRGTNVLVSSSRTLQ